MFICPFKLLQLCNPYKWDWIAILHSDFLYLISQSSAFLTWLWDYSAFFYPGSRTKMYFRVWSVYGPISTEILPHVCQPISAVCSCLYLPTFLRPFSSVFKNLMLYPFRDIMTVTTTGSFHLFSSLFASFTTQILKFLVNSSSQLHQWFLSFRLRSNATQSSSHLYISLHYNSHPTLQCHSSCPSHHKTFPHAYLLLFHLLLESAGCSAGCLLVFLLHLLSSQCAVI